MTLLDFAKEKMHPTVDQEKAFKALDEFWASDVKVFLLKGYAGTGKTTLIKTISQYVQHLKWNAVLLAPTGRAAKILSEKTGFVASTIHRGIYNLNEVDEIEMSTQKQKQYKFRFNLLSKISNITNIYLFDEASMISDKFSEQDFFIFGSGILLKDIITFIAPQNKARKDKIIFIGDPAQLPAVSDSVSGALSADYLLQKYQIRTQKYELTEVVRQNKESGILKTAQHIRDRLLSRNKTPFLINDQYSDVHILKPEDTPGKYHSLNPGLEYNKTAIINFSNKSALEYNLLVRERFFKNSTQVQTNDLLIINQNNYNYDVELFNGTMVKVMNVSSAPILKSNIKSYTAEGESCLINIKFRNVSIEVPTDHGNQIIDCLILDDFLYSSQPQLKYEEHIALYLDFKYRHPDLKPKTTAFKDAIRSDPYFNALRVKFGYAITCHKAQGGEWESVLVNMDISLGKQSDMFNRWIYTAVTRAQKTLYLFNHKRVSPFSKLKFTCTYLFPENKVLDSIETISFRLPFNLEEYYVSMGLQNEPFFKQEKFKEIMARAHHLNYNIIARQTHNFQEQYTFEKEDKKATLVFWYNGQNKFTRITLSNSPQNDKPFCNYLLDKFIRPINIILEEPEITKSPADSWEEKDQQSEMLFPEGKEELRILYDSLVDSLSPYDITISKIDHEDYLEVYNFQRKKETAVIQFYYNNSLEFTTAINQQRHCNSDDLLRDIAAALTLLKEEK